MITLGISDDRPSDGWLAQGVTLSQSPAASPLSHQTPAASFSIWIHLDSSSIWIAFLFGELFNLDSFSIWLAFLFG